MPGIERLGLCLAQCYQLAASGFLLFLVYDIWYAQGCCAGAFGVREDVELGHVEAVEEVVALLEQLGPLASAAHHHVDTDEGIGHLLLYQLNLVGKELLVVAAVHEAQHLVGTALQRNVEVGHERARPATVVDELVGEQIGLDAAYPIAADRLHQVERFDQSGEVFARGLAEIAYVDAGQHNLFCTFGSGLARLLDQGTDRRVAREASGVGYRAVGAEVVAAVLHLEEVSGAVAFRARRLEAADVLCLHAVVLVECFLSALAAVLAHESIREEADEACFLVAAQHQVYSLYLAHALRLQLCVAASHNYQRAGMVARHAVDYLSALVVGHFRHRAGVYQADVGLLAGSRLAHSHLLEEFAEGGGLREIELASQRVVGGFLALEYRTVYHISHLCDTPYYIYRPLRRCFPGAVAKPFAAHSGLSGCKIKKKMPYSVFLCICMIE